MHEVESFRCPSSSTTSLSLSTQFGLWRCFFSESFSRSLGCAAVSICQSAAISLLPTAAICYLPVRPVALTCGACQSRPALNGHLAAAVWLTCHLHTPAAPSL
ncbi:unnamed protein product, partial [Closterium sp. Naga37s-1]